MSDNESAKKTAAIVLGNGLEKVSAGGVVRYEPTAQAKARLDLAYALFEEGKADVIVSTGKYGPMFSIDPEVVGPNTEAEVGGAYLIAKARGGRPVDGCLLYEDRSIDTIGNAWYAKKLCLEPASITSCIVVTSDYHVERSRVIFEWVLGPAYAVTCAEAPSHLSDVERERRDTFEAMLTDYVEEHLVANIPAGDDEAIAAFMEGEHRRMFEDIARGLPGIPSMPKTQQ